MRTSQVVIVTLSAIVILSTTQVPFAATLQTRADYSAATHRVASAYHDARAECNPIAGHDKDMCIVVAKAAEKRALAAADVNYFGTIKSKLDSRIANADAGWMIARASCDAKSQVERPACVTQAKAENVRLVAAAEATHAR